MTQTIANLGEIGTAGPTTPALLRPFDLPILRDGALWDLSLGPYSTPRIEVWDLRTRTLVASPGTVTIQNAALGVMRFSPTAASFTSGTYEARFILQAVGGYDEPSGLFRFSIGASA